VKTYLKKNENLRYGVKRKPIGDFICSERGIPLLRMENGEKWRIEKYGEWRDLFTPIRGCHTFFEKTFSNTHFSPLP